MAEPDGTILRKPSRAVRAEAAAWIARLHGPGRTVADEESFRRWLTADPAHSVAFESMTALWEAGARLQSDVLTRLKVGASQKRGAPWRWIRLGWAAAGLAGVAVFGAMWRLTGDTVTTGVGEQRTLQLEDGTRITLNTATRLQVRYDRMQRSVRLDRGEALFEVKAQAERPFVVAAGGRQITALGTAFVVRHEPERLSVTLVEGKVAVSERNPAAASVPVGHAAVAGASAELRILAPGERVVFAEGKPAVLDQPALEKVTAWRQGVIAMDKMPLSVAVAEMNRYSEVPLAIEGLDADSIQVSGVFKAGDSREFAHALARSHGLHPIDSDGQIVLVGSQAQ